MYIEIGYEIVDGKIQLICGVPDKELVLTELEESALETIYSLLSNDVDLSKMHLEKNADAYTSLFYGEYNDFLRFKISDRTKWISIRMAPCDRENNLDNPLFVAQKNKKQLHWKSKIDSIDDLSQFKCYFVNACLAY